MLLEIPVKKLFQKAFVRESGEIINGSNFIKNRQ